MEKKEREWTDWPDIQNTHPGCVFYAWSDSKDNHDIFILLLWAVYKLSHKWKQGMNFNLWMHHDHVYVQNIGKANVTFLELQKR